MTRETLTPQLLQPQLEQSPEQLEQLAQEQGAMFFFGLVWGEGYLVFGCVYVFVWIFVDDLSFREAMKEGKK